MCVVEPLRGLAQVKEGGDSTVFPKLRTFEFDRGKLFEDVWTADGKPYLSQRVLSRVRACKVFLAISLPVWGFLTFERLDSPGEDHVFTLLRQPLLQWWSDFTAFDKHDLAKACSVGSAEFPDPTIPRAKREKRIYKEPNM